MATGTVAARAPAVPATSIQLASWLCCSGANHWRYALKEAIRQADTPAPISARPTHRPASEVLVAKTAAPIAAMTSSADSVRRGPYLSSQIPSGSWSEPKATK